MVRSITTIIIVLTFFMSCTKSDYSQQSDDFGIETENLSGVMVRQSTLELFADFSEYISDSGQKTKSADTDSLLSLESLLDRNLAEEIETSSGNIIRQVPFKGNKQITYAFIGEKFPQSVDKQTLSIINKFLVTSFQKEGGCKVQVVTMVSQPEYFNAGQKRDISYLHRGNYTGLIIYSELDGTLKGINYFEDGCIKAARPMRSESVTDTVESKYLYTVRSKSEAATKSDEWGSDYVLDESICIAYRDIVYGTINAGLGSDGPQWWGLGENDKDECCDGSEGGGSMELLPVYNVNLSVNNEEYGSVSGSGSYIEDTRILISASAIWTNYVEAGKYFDHWTGVFSDRGSCFTYRVISDIESTAVFYKRSDALPCLDTVKGSMFPLYQLYEIAPSGGWNYRGGTFGKVRNGGKRMHSGIDLYAPVGTPVYAVCDGVVTKVISEQPDMIDNGEGKGIYPSNYTGNKDATGNRIDYSGIINNEQVTLQNYHLRAGDAIAVNPRTGEEFKLGDNVYQGEIIGYTGITGNAFGCVPHLHIGIKNNGINRDPLNYLNGDISNDFHSIINVLCNHYSYSEISLY